VRGGCPPGQHPRNPVPSREEPRVRDASLSTVHRPSGPMIPRVIPVLLLSDGGLVKTVRFQEPRYVGDPINAVRIFNDKQTDEITILDIRASVEGRQPDESVIAEIASEAFMPIGYGGGVGDL